MKSDKVKRFVAKEFNVDIKENRHVLDSICEELVGDKPDKARIAKLLGLNSDRSSLQRIDDFIKKYGIKS